MGPIGANLLDGLELLGVVAFALSGALAVAARGRDVAVICTAAVATGLAGASLRDLLIGAPMIWLDRPAYLAGCLVAAGAVWALGERPWSGRAALWCDAAGLGAIAAVGVARAASVGVTPLAAVVVGVLAAAAGGVVRAGFSGETPAMLERALYLAAATAGTLLFVALTFIQTDAGLAALAGAALAFALRAGALRYGWTLPGPSERD